MTTANRSIEPATTQLPVTQFSAAPQLTPLVTDDLSGEKRATVFTRIIDAPQELVFKMWTDPTHMAQWWGPKGFTNPVCELDVRPGGAILIHMRSPEGEIFPMGGAFNEIVEPERLVMTTTAFEDEAGNPQLEVLNTITFDPHNGKTKLTVEAVIVKASPAVAAALAGMEEGWNQSLDCLAGHVATAANSSAAKKTNNSDKGNRDRKMTLVAAPGEPTIIIKRTFDAPRQLVFEAWTKPEHVVRWWGCSSSSMPVCEIDLRPGGAYRYVMRMPDNSEYPFKGVYQEITPPERLVHTQIFDVEPYSVHEMLVTVIFDEQDGKTTITETIRHKSVEARDGHVASGMEAGAAQSLDRLAELLMEVDGSSVHQRQQDVTKTTDNKEKSVTQINPYLNFNGNCRDAMTFYQQCLGGELMLQTIEGSPIADQMPNAAGQNILHSSLTKDGLVLLASDMVGQEGLVQGNSVSLCINCSSEEEINTFFSKLSEGGKVNCPVMEQFWGATFAALTDKFGVQWLLNYDKAAQS